MKYFSTFSGIGGFELGIERAMDNQHATPEQQDRQGRNRNIDEQRALLCSAKKSAFCVGYSEIDKYACQVYEKHFGGTKNYGDATKIDPRKLPSFNLLVGGFPCQAFSIAGSRKGFEDTRGTLFFEIARILKIKQPRLVVLENVKGLLNHDGGNTFTKILQTLDELGYDAEWQVLNSKHFGVPQNRERVFIIGRFRRKCRGQIFPIQGTIGKVDRQVTSTAIDKNYGKSIDNHGQRTMIELTKNVSDAQRIYDTKGIAKTLKGNGVAIAKTLKGNGVAIENSIRRLTPKECERLQGFPDDWTKGLSDSQRYKCCGNAVTVNVIEAIFNKLLKKY